MKNEINKAIANYELKNELIKQIDTLESIIHLYAYFNIPEKNLIDYEKYSKKVDELSVLKNKLNIINKELEIK